MTKAFAVERIKKNGTDPIMLSCVIMLAGIGLASLFSASYDYARHFFGNQFYFLIRQGIALGVSVIALALAANADLKILQDRIAAILAVTFFLSILPFIPGIGLEKNGASRWINFGFTTFQPSELAKLALVLYLAHIFSKKQGREADPWTDTVIPPVVITVLAALLAYLQNDFSTAAFILVLGLMMFWIARVRIRYILSFVLAPIPILLTMLFTEEHRVQRIITFLRPDHDSQGISYQVNASLEALANGGFWGQGVGLGTKKLGSIPEVQSDFVFAAFGEEFGFFGVVLFFAVVLALAWRGYRTGALQKSAYEQYLGFGLTSLILYQVLVNMAVVSGLLPATGMPMPFFSAGGSSLLITCVSCGLLLNISRRLPRLGEEGHV